VHQVIQEYSVNDPKGLLSDCLMLDGPEDQGKLRANNPTTICSFYCCKTGESRGTQTLRLSTRQPG